MQIKDSFVIKAPQEKVWHVMLDKETYKQWTSAFNEGSTYEGSWEKGADIRFVGPNEDGTVSGMISRIDDSRPFDHAAVQHRPRQVGQFPAGMGPVSVVMGGTVEM